MAAAKKKISAFIKLQLPAGKANPSPPVGPALGQHGVNIMGFCKDFNSKSAQLRVAIGRVCGIHFDSFCRNCTVCGMW